MELFESFYFILCYYLSHFLLLFSILVKVINITDVSDKNNSIFATVVKKSKLLLTSSYYLSLIVLDNLKENSNINMILSTYHKINDNYKYYTDKLYSLYYDDNIENNDNQDNDNQYNDNQDNDNQDNKYNKLNTFLNKKIKDNKEIEMETLIKKPILLTLEEVDSFLNKLD